MFRSSQVHDYFASTNEIVRLYESGLSSRAVAQRVGIAKSSVLRILKEMGVEMRPHGVRY